MTYLISYGGGSRASHGRSRPDDALQFAYSLERTGEVKIRITDTETGQTYSVAQFERFIRGVRAG
jgi:hypothetical protein